MIVCPACETLPHKDFLGEVVSCGCERLKTYKNRNGVSWLLVFRYGPENYLYQDGVNVRNDELVVKLAIHLAILESVMGT